MKSEVLSAASWRVADAFGVVTFEAVFLLTSAAKRFNGTPVMREEGDFDDVLPFEAVRPSKFEGKRPDGVPVKWELDESGQLMSVEMIDSQSNYGCGVWREGAEWSCGVYKPFDDIMADGLTALGFDEDVIGVYRPKMTQQEAQAWFERLTKIWVPESLETNQRVSGPRWKFEFGQFQFGSSITEEVRFAMHFEKQGCFLSLTRESLTGEVVHWYEEYEEPRTISTGTLITGETGHIHSDLTVPPGEEAVYAQFADEWMPFFRRGCWLSGVPIEASVHEKAEWMRGFTKEEIQAWNLEF